MKGRILFSSGAILAMFLLSLFLAPPSGLKAFPSSSGRIVATGDMMLPRFGHAAALLPDGKVLIVAGMQGNGTTESAAEIYDPASGRSSAAGKLLSARGYGATATLLPGGKVLVAGGSCGAGCILSAAEIYDPRAGVFRATGSMSTPRAEARAVRLQNGDALIVGGDSGPDGPPLASAELYNAATGTFSPTGRMRTPRDYFDAVLLKDGRVLALGGSSTGQHPGMTEEASAEIYDPATGRFTPTGSMTMPRNKPGAALLADGRVLVVGGQNTGPSGARLASTEIYDPATGKFTRGPEMGARRYKLLYGVVALGNGRVLVAGGSEQPEIFDPVTESFFPVAGAKLDAFYFSTTTLLANGDVLISGGYGAHMGAGAIPHAWIYHPN